MPVAVASLRRRSHAPRGGHPPSSLSTSLHSDFLLALRHLCSAGLSAPITSSVPIHYLRYTTVTPAAATTDLVLPSRPTATATTSCALTEAPLPPPTDPRPTGSIRRPYAGLSQRAVRLPLVVHFAAWTRKRNANRLNTHARAKPPVEQQTHKHPRCLCTSTAARSPLCETGGAASCWLYNNDQAINFFTQKKHRPKE